FRGLTLKQFAGDLRRLTDSGQPTKSRKGRAGKIPTVSEDEMVRDVQGLYSRAAAPDTTYGQIDEMAKRLESLTKPALVRVAEGVELHGMANKKKDAIVAAIRQRLMSRKGASQKVSRIDRSPFANAEPQPAAAVIVESEGTEH